MEAKPRRRRVMTKREAKAWKARWERVNAFEREELRATPMATKFRQLSTLMNSARALGWLEGTAAEDAEVRRRFRRLRQHYARKRHT